jgi:hypothetical protein
VATVCLVALLLVVLSNCTGPTEGVTVYLHPQFSGDSQTFDRSVRDLEDEYRDSSEDTDWDDCISSIRVDEGWIAYLHEHDDFHGNTLRVGSGESIPYLGDVMGGCGTDWDDYDWNDCASSITIERLR